MPIVQVKGVANPIQFPDSMSEEEIKAILQQKFNADMFKRATGELSDALTPVTNTAAPYNPSLVDKMGSGIANTLKDTGIISDNYGAQRIGKNVSALAELLPGIGDATAGDEFGRAVAQGDKFGMAMAGLGVIPVAGDAAKQALRKAKTINLPSGKLGSDQYKMIKQSDPKAKAKTNPDGTVNVTYLEEYQPRQLKGPLHEFDPDALELSEGTFKNADTYKGDKNKPITVTKQDGDYVILDGHHRAKLAKQDGRNVKAVVLPIEDVAKMKKDNIHQADMRKEWIARGGYKPEEAAQSLPMDEVKSVEQLSESIKGKKGIKTLSLYEDRKGNIKLDTIIVDKGGRGSGVGSEAMEDIIKYADKNNKLVKLTPAVKDDFQGTTSQARLRKFYKRFGFVENKGRNKDYAISELMYREPK
tara:strand:- start:177 stop:1424 length:1248 start_codon:yes stop_codon:yes gene_type:complete